MLLISTVVILPAVWPRLDGLIAKVGAATFREKGVGLAGIEGTNLELKRRHGLAGE